MFDSISVKEDTGKIRNRTSDERNAVKQRRVSRLSRRWWGRRLVNVFLAWHLFALTIWLIPANSAIVQDCVGTVRPYMTLTGFAQSWSMFSPYPDRLEVTLEAQITYQNGEKRSWFFPRMARLSYVRRYEEERWRKLVEVATHGNTQVIWPALARYAARVNNDDPQNRPVSVELFQHSRQIPAPGGLMPPIKAEPLQTRDGAFIQPIHPEDLQ